MIKRLQAVFDGEVFRPKEPVDLAPDTECIIEVSDENSKGGVQLEPHPLELISQLATDMGPADLAERFERYAGRRLKA
jgi:hypothetical protein